MLLFGYHQPLYPSSRGFTSQSNELKLQLQPRKPFSPPCVSEFECSMIGNQRNLTIATAKRTCINDFLGSDPRSKC
ncbi:hypothetical protein XA68_14585 [Ophiocordyceps unilateralis]|uniref:Uncharacterized protein n=1 Tax=Ophiocordyceps unilateralis TaxID=268505 RepID=A0A2A9PAB3_OPHUN|nr:hypothetical protein XA68_14585 [Ophiocordyceps unilateralis]